MQDAGYAALQIIPSFKGLESNLESGTAKALLAAGTKGGKRFGDAVADNAKDALRRLDVDSSTSKALATAGERGGEKFGDAAAEAAGDSFADKAKDKFKTASLAVGVAGAAALTAGMLEAVSRESSAAKWQASLGIPEGRAKELGHIAGELYADAYGESFGEVNDAVGTVITSFRNMDEASGKRISGLTAKALDFAAAFEIDVSRAVQVAGTVMNSGLAKDADRAFDLLFRSSQKVPVALREDLLDAAEEYGTFFDTLGFSGKEAFNILAAGSDQGIYGIDKAGDAIKEFTIRATDGSDATQTAFGDIGLNAQKMSNDILAGGDAARTATRRIIDGLLGIEDPTERAKTALALFGTPMEDLNVRKIPAFLRGLRGTEDRLGKVAGTANKADEALGSTTEADFTKLKRSIEQDVVGFLGNEVIPFIKNDVKPTIDSIGDALDSVPDWAIKGSVGGFFGLLAAGKVAGSVGNLRGLVGGLGSGGGGGILGSAKPVPVFVTNPGFGGDAGIGGKSGGGTTKAGIGRNIGRAVLPFALGDAAYEATAGDLYGLDPHTSKDPRDDLSPIIRTGGGAFGIGLKPPDLDAAKKDAKELGDQWVETSGRITGATKDMIGGVGNFDTSMTKLPKKVVTEITAPGADISRKQALALAKQYDLTPKEKRTLFRVLDIDRSKNSTKDLQGVLAQTPKSVNTNVTVSGVTEARNQVDGLIGALRTVATEADRALDHAAQVALGSRGRTKYP